MSDEGSIKLIKEEKGCEFPEGNKVDCAYFSVTIGERTRTSSVVFRENSDYKSFCLTAKDGKRELSPFKEANIFLDCTKKTSEMHFKLKFGEKEKECILAL